MNGPIHELFEPQTSAGTSPRWLRLLRCVLIAAVLIGGLVPASALAQEDDEDAEESDDERASDGESEDADPLAEAEALLHAAALAEAEDNDSQATVQDAIAKYVSASLLAHSVDPKLYVHLTASVLAHGINTNTTTELRGQARPIMRRQLERFRDQLNVNDLDTATLLVVTSVEAAIHSAILEDPARLEDPAFEQELVSLCCRYLGVPEQAPNPNPMSNAPIHTPTGV